MNLIFDDSTSPVAVTSAAPIVATHEAEDIIASGFVAANLPAASGGQGVSLWAPGYLARTGELSFTHTGDSGLFDLEIDAFDENDGDSQLEIRVNGTLITTIDLNQDLGSGQPNADTLDTFTAAGLSLNDGDVVTITGIAHRSDYARIDRVILRDVTPETISYEAENLITSGYAALTLAGASGGQVASLWAPGHLANSGTLSHTHQDGAGRFDLTVHAYDENDGDARLVVLVNGEQAGVIDLDQDLGSSQSNATTLQAYTIEGLLLRDGDVIAIEGARGATDYARIDRISLTDVSPPPITYEAEDIILSGYVAAPLRDASGGQGASLWAPGYSAPAGVLSVTHAGGDGVFDLQISAYDENDGASQLFVAVNGQRVGAITLDQDLGSGQPNATTLRTYSIDGLQLSDGDVVTITGIRNNSEYARIDQVSFINMTPDNTALVAVDDVVANAPEGDATVPVTGDIQVNTFTTGDQRHPSVAALAGGGFVATWTSDGQDGSGDGIYAQRFDSAGIAVGSEFQVNAYTSNDQRISSVTALADGGFVVTWSGNSQDVSGNGIYGQRYDSAGAAVGSDFRVNTFTNGGQQYSSVAALADGGFVVTWSSWDQDGSIDGIYAQRYDSAGAQVGSEFQVNTYTISNQLYSSVAALEDGGFVVSWESFGQDGSGSSIYAQRYDNAGVQVGSEFQVNTFTNSYQRYSSVAALADGGFVVTWSSENQDGSGYGIYAQRYDSTGVAVGSEFQVNTFTDSSQQYSSVVALADGGFVVTWSSENQDGSRYGIYAQRYDANNMAVGEETRLNEITAGTQAAVTSLTGEPTAVLTDGTLVSTWSGFGTEEVFVRLFDLPTIATTYEDAALTIDDARLLANDSDEDGDTLTITHVDAHQRQWRKRIHQW